MDLTKDDLNRKEIRSYVRESILHYARWMVANEKFYLDTPDELEFPTETWAAQELRKGNVLLMAASLTEEAEGASFQMKGREILDQAWESLNAFSTKSYSRPMVLVLQQQYIERFYQVQVESLKSEDFEQFDFGTPQTFIPQKQRLKSAIKSPQVLICCLRLLRPWAWKTPIQKSWLSQRCRSWLESMGAL
ncbi:MAG: hypothetical protein COA78_32005 [Blastopirellula sp.]|nr:MAG: hypothetical protein COA78_32005 [Blastopirellula sp.]